MGGIHNEIYDSSTDIDGMIGDIGEMLANHVKTSAATLES